MAIIVIDPFEPIEITKDHRTRGLVALGIGERPLEFTQEPAPIEDGHERVLVGHVLQFADTLLGFHKLAAHAIELVHKLHDGGTDRRG